MLNSSTVNATNIYEPPTEDPRIGLIVMLIILSLTLFFMCLLLLLPKSAQDAVFRFISRQSPDQSFNYIDVGLYKTRHSMYRKEVYSMAMQGGRLQDKRKSLLSPVPYQIKQHFQIGQSTACERISSEEDSKCFAPEISKKNVDLAFERPKVFVTYMSTPVHQSIPNRNVALSNERRPSSVSDNFLVTSQSDVWFRNSAVENPSISSSLPQLSYPSPTDPNRRNCLIVGNHNTVTKSHFAL
ncbi:hypothetical protein CRM22_007713 [Opisthorchis felineus]|uniref:Uncharacterized protein n=1 Tax=Opisthorchis felineus TaxID=147828 RepID=A0A4S2LF25_OPIFE|nr:hypothetical protein CRM22_007713 [Opisthorchis felineus]TGZ61950.1 hypothetical protein CRM22_007713 [Opisthorchis felineus]TGZ61951.1 hypothetical protein CRM22_007713 [Opisthorchis felineus]